MPSRTALVTSLVLLGIAALAGCAIGPSDRPAVAVRDAPIPPAPPTTTSRTAVALPPLRPPGASDVFFGDCSKQFRNWLGPAAGRGGLRYECGRVPVPLNPSEPRARRYGEFELEVLRVGSGVPLIIVGDVAAEPGRLLAARLANQLPVEFLTTFALIGVDRRGTGESNAVRCVPYEVREQLVGIDPGAERAAEATLDAANAANQRCVQEIDEQLTMLDSLRTATDLERLRAALRVDRLHAIGFGDGSRVLAAYLELFSSTAGRIVLDGVPDPTLDAIGIGQEQAAAAEQAFDAFAASCASRPDCPLGREPRNAVQNLAGRLRERSVTASDGLTRVGAGTMYSALLIGLADQQRWPQLAQAIGAAGNGDVSGLAELVSPLLHFQDELPARLDAALLTVCNDTATRVPPNRVEQLAEDWRTRSPLFGPLFALRLLACSPAPVPSHVVPPPRASNTPPVLLLGAEGDPITPLRGTQRMADALQEGHLVTWQGYGHAAFPRTPCITSTVQRFLVDGQLPRTGTICPP